MKYGFHLRVLHPCQPLGIHVISITSSGLLLRAGLEEIMREDVPVPPAEDLVAQMRGDRATSGGSTAFYFFFFFCEHAEGDRHWLCAVWHRTTAETKGQVQMAWKGRNGWAPRKCPELNDMDRMCFSSLAVKHRWHSFPPSDHSRRCTMIFSKASFIKGYCLLMTGKVYICKTRFVLEYVPYFILFFLKITHRTINRCTRTGTTWGKTISWADVCLYSLDLKHQMHIGFSSWEWIFTHWLLLCYQEES